jgi:hypothetical protein
MPTQELCSFAAKVIPETPEDPNNPLCGTQACVAGWVVILGSPPGSYLTSNYAVLPGGIRMGIGHYASRLLRLDEVQASYLFDANRTRDEVLEALEALIEDTGHQRFPYYDEEDDENYDEEDDE